MPCKMTTWLQPGGAAPVALVRLDKSAGEIKANVIRSRAVALRTCTVSFTGPSGVRHSVEVIAESIYEAAALGISALKNAGWADAIAQGTELEVQGASRPPVIASPCSRFAAGAMASRSAPTRR